MPLPGADPADRLQQAHDAGARDLHAAAVELRGGFLKLGQFVSARPDLLPDVYVEELSKLQDRVPPAPASVMRAVIEADVGPIDELFCEFDYDSASAASLAQVHRATRSDGRPVAVKAQYPRVGQIVPDEIADGTRIMGLISKVVHHVDLPTIAKALEQTVLSELDYENEARNIERFRDNFRDEPQVEVPSVHHDLSRGRVLVMDWVEGENLARALIGADHATAEEAARILVDSYLKQILVDGFLHADPHPGNFLLHPGPRLGFVDFGACSALSAETRESIRALYRAGLRNDLPLVVEALDALGFKTRSGRLDALVNWAQLFSFDDVEEDRDSAWAGLITAARQDPLVTIPEELIMLGRVLIVQTGLVARIGPSWSMEELVDKRLADAG
ncbi:MAG: AarF/ABC1/UbiB kinase family protein [Actinobacteria bacterium]|nr:MAG: AarF/ABC1/UbiB kinase family protein [Actinomycetota bacterium]RIK06194.1 MAG: hypothetical protein DCC48_07115 [Acidobacteriota bacterium]